MEKQASLLGSSFDLLQATLIFACEGWDVACHFWDAAGMYQMS